MAGDATDAAREEAHAQCFRETVSTTRQADGTRLFKFFGNADKEILDLFLEDDSLNVYAGKLEVRPPGAPTIGPADLSG